MQYVDIVFGRLPMNVTFDGAADYDETRAAPSFQLYLYFIRDFCRSKLNTVIEKSQHETMFSRSLSAHSDAISTESMWNIVARTFLLGLPGVLLWEGLASKGGNCLPINCYVNSVIKMNDSMYFFNIS